MHSSVPSIVRNADLHGIDAADQEAKRKARLKPAIVALYQTAAMLDYLDKRLFELPLLARLDLKSHEQTTWINVITPPIQQCKAEAADKLQKTQQDTCQFFIQPGVQPPYHGLLQYRSMGNPFPDSGMDSHRSHGILFLSTCI